MRKIIYEQTLKKKLYKNVAIILLYKNDIYFYLVIHSFTLFFI